MLRPSGPLVALLAATMVACSSSPQPAAADLGNRDSGSSGSSSEAAPPPLLCTGLYEGCLCSPENAMHACAAPHITIGTHTICPPGLMVCQGGHWGGCVATDLSTTVTAQIQDYESTCTLGTKVQWSPLAMTGQVPAGANLVVGLQTAPSKAQLDQQVYEVAATFDSTTPTPWQPIDVPTSLGQAMQDPQGVYLRITALLTPAPGGELPTVSWSQTFVCVNP